MSLESFNGRASPTRTSPGSAVYNSAGASPSKDKRQQTGILDVAELDLLDPSLADGHHVVYDREVPMELLAPPDHEEGKIVNIRTKLLLLGEDLHPDNVRVELTTEEDLFFHYSHTIDARNFRELKQDQKLQVAFSEYPSVLIKMLNNCIREPQSNKAAFSMYPDGRARLDFVQNVGYKMLDLLALDFVCSSEKVVRQHIHYRYESLKSRLVVLQARLLEIHNIVKLKNPSLLLQIQKTVSKHPINVSRSGLL